MPKLTFFYLLLASQMTRHLVESDFYSSGKFAGLGSRHNVNIAKEKGRERLKPR